jgi:hypothetical protein
MPVTLVIEQHKWSWFFIEGSLIAVLKRLLKIAEVEVALFIVKSSFLLVCKVLTVFSDEYQPVAY